MTGVVYYIECSINQRVYVGSTTRSPKQRWAEHQHYLRKGTHHSPHLQRAWAKYVESAAGLIARGISLREVERRTGISRKVLAREAST